MADKFYERHQDYVFDIGNSFANTAYQQQVQIGTLVAGRQYPGLPLQIDLDAPFIMRGIAARMQWDLETGQNDLSQLYFRLKRANTRYTCPQDQWLPFEQFARVFGQGGNQGIMWPHEGYPQGGVIEVDLWNNGDEDLAGVQLVFRGVKRFPYPKPSLYPQKISRILNWTRSVKIAGVGVSGPTAMIERFPLAPPVKDGDFVLRKISGGCVYNPNAPAAFFTARNVWCAIRDENDKPYSNAPVDVNILCGQGTMALASGLDNSQQFGPWHPGLLYPEIYIPRNVMYSMDIFRDDSAYLGQAGLGAVRMDFALGGIKVFQQ